LRPVELPWIVGIRVSLAEFPLLFLSTWRVGGGG